MRVWKIVFAVAAAFNFLVGLPMLLAPAAVLAGLGQPIPEDLLITRLAALLIAVLGLGYGMVARDPVANRPILWLGLIGKAPIPVLVMMSGGAATLANTTFVLSLGDLTFAALFLIFLVTHPRPAAV